MYVYIKMDRHLEMDTWYGDGDGDGDTDAVIRPDGGASAAREAQRGFQERGRQQANLINDSDANDISNTNMIVP